MLVLQVPYGSIDDGVPHSLKMRRAPWGRGGLKWGPIRLGVREAKSYRTKRKSAQELTRVACVECACKMNFLSERVRNQTNATHFVRGPVVPV